MGFESRCFLLTCNLPAAGPFRQELFDVFRAIGGPFHPRLGPFFRAPLCFLPSARTLLGTTCLRSPVEIPRSDRAR